MKKIGDIMGEMGFNKAASEDSQKAFIKHLIKAANEAQSQRPTNIHSKSDKESQKPEQMSFNLEDKVS